MGGCQHSVLSAFTPRTSHRFQAADHLGCFFRPNDAGSTRQECLVHTEHEILIFLYFEYSSLEDFDRILEVIKAK